MIRHIVLMNLADGCDAAELQSVMEGLAALQDDIAGFTAFMHGPNRDFESMSPHCAYAFTCDFADQTTSMIYIDNAIHQALGARLVSLCTGGVQGITVIDLDVAA